MDTATVVAVITSVVAALTSIGVLVLQIIQMRRYVKLESEVKRVTTELDQTLNRLHRASELSREIYSCQLRNIRYLSSLWAEIAQERREGDQQAVWENPLKYQHLGAEAENLAKSNVHMRELHATANVIGDNELKQLVQQLDEWIKNIQPDSQADDLNRITEQVQERIYFLIDQRLSSKN